MNRRMFFNSILASVLLVSSASVITGCQYETSFQKESKLIPVIEYAQLSHKKNLQLMEDLGYTQRYKSNFSQDVLFTLPWFVGPQLDISKNDYLVKMYSTEDLLFTGFGLGDKINLYYRNVDNNRLNQLGFESSKDLFEFVYNKLTSYSAKDVYIMLAVMEERKILSVKDVLNYERINQKNKDLIGFNFYNYNEFDKSMVSTPAEKELLNENPLKSWRLSVNGKQVSLTESDFIPYALTVIICDEIIKNTPKDQVINVY